jgi:hypothetical protein
MGTTTGALEERDIYGAPYKVGDYVFVRCLVTTITPSAAGGNGGAGDTVGLTVETPGNVGEKQGVSFNVSPVQTRRAGNSTQA